MGAFVIVGQVSAVLVLLILACGFGVIPFYATSIVHKVALGKLPLTKNSESTEHYRTLPVNITQKVYFFNITNLDGFLKRNEKPHLQEVGPYVFTSVWLKNMSWEGEFLTFNEKRTFYFDPSRSNGTLDDEVYIVDMVHVGVMKLYDAMPPSLIKTGLSYLLTREFLVKKKVREALYEGYKDDIASLAKAFNLDFPLIDGKIGYFLGENGTSAATLTVFTGEGKNLHKLNHLKSVNGEEKFPYYGDDCNTVHGSNGQLLPPSDEPIKEFSLFDPFLCHPWPVYYKNTTEENGITLRNYYSDGNFFSPSLDSKLDSCYEPVRYPVQGIFNASACQHGKDIFLSSPHFLGGDPKLLKDVSGLSPDETKHGVRYRFDKYGHLLDFKLRVQINAPLRSSIFKENLPKIVYPILWQELGFDETARRQISEHVFSKTIHPSLRRTTAGAALLLVLLSIVSLVFAITKKKKDVSTNQDLSEGESTVEFHQMSLPDSSYRECIVELRGILIDNHVPKTIL